MGIQQRSHGRLFIAALLGGSALWSLLTQPRLAPGLAALAVAQGLLASFWIRARAPSPRLISAFLGTGYLGLAYLVAAVVAGPNTTRFWIVFVVAASIVAPIMVLGWRLSYGRSKTQ
jgi:uncharacterized membrane protein